jgi:AAA15 family ATPase/GTPase
MVIDLTFKNYRSIKEEQLFSLEANSSNLKTQNVFCPLAESKNLKLVKSAVLYGSNASGKSNLIRLMWSLKYFILNSIDLKSGDLIPEKYYDPFLLDIDSKNQPIEIKINFIPNNNKRHRYIIKFNKEGILYEYLGVYETNRISKIFERKDGNEFVEFGDGMVTKEDKRVPNNHLYLSKIGNTPNDQFRDIYLYFKSIEIWNIPSIHHTESLYNKVQKIYNNPENNIFRKRLSKLISVADTKIMEVHVSERPDKDFEKLPPDVRAKVAEQLKFETFGVHPVFHESNDAGIQMLTFNDQESQGTRMMFAIGGLILEAFEREKPTVIFLDEFDNSLHPDLAKFLVELFHNPKVNRNNSQLIFATHETTLLDKKIFRKDQIWFGEKNKYGITEFYSVKDFKDLKGVRSDIPFDKWYRTGKFGAVPNIRKFEFIAEYE